MLVWGPVYAELGGKAVFRAAAVVAAAGCVITLLLGRAQRSSQAPAAARAAG
jgi:hypothetical protein